MRPGVGGRCLARSPARAWVASGRGRASRVRRDPATRPAGYWGGCFVPEARRDELLSSGTAAGRTLGFPWLSRNRVVRGSGEQTGCAPIWAPSVFSDSRGERAEATKRMEVTRSATKPHTYPAIDFEVPHRPDNSVTSPLVPPRILGPDAGRARLSDIPLLRTPTVTRRSAVRATMARAPRHASRPAPLARGAAATSWLRRDSCTTSRDRRHARAAGERSGQRIAVGRKRHGERGDRDYGPAGRVRDRSLRPAATPPRSRLRTSWPGIRR